MMCRVVKLKLDQETYYAQFRKDREVGGKGYWSLKRNLHHTWRLIGINGAMKMKSQNVSFRYH